MLETNATTRVLISTKRTPSAAAEIVRSGGGLLTLRIDTTPAPILEVGRAITWSKDELGGAGPVTIGTVVSTYEATGSTFVVVSPRTWESGAPARPVAKVPAPDSASVLRLRLAPNEVLGAAIRDANQEWEVRIRELSTEGITVFLPGASESTHPVGTALEVSMPLPEGGHRLRFVGRVVRSTALTRGAAVGLRFDATAPDHPDQQRALRGFLSARQRRSAAAP